jgi:hypothetical protein
MIIKEFPGFCGFLYTYKFTYIGIYFKSSFRVNRKNGTALRMRPEKPKLSVTAGMA